jgi:hypothetical protein
MSDSGSDDGSSWDVETYRVDYESEEHWTLRKVFENWLGFLTFIYSRLNFQFLLGFHGSAQG